MGTHFFFGVSGDVSLLLRPPVPVPPRFMLKGALLGPQLLVLLRPPLSWGKKKELNKSPDLGQKRKKFSKAPFTVDTLANQPRQTLYRI